MDFIHIGLDCKFRLKVLISAIPSLAGDLNVKVTDLEFPYIKVKKFAYKLIYIAFISILCTIN